MRDILDVHTHTVASGHAYNSMMEMIHAAQEKELEAKAARLAELNAALNIDEKRKEPMEKRSMKDVLKAYQERADAQSQGEKGGTNEWNR